MITQGKNKGKKIIRGIRAGQAKTLLSKLEIGRAAPNSTQMNLKTLHSVIHAPSYTFRPYPFFSLLLFLRSSDASNDRKHNPNRNTHEQNSSKKIEIEKGRNGLSSHGCHEYGIKIRCRSEPADGHSREERKSPGRSKQRAWGQIHPAGHHPCRA